MSEPNQVNPQLRLRDLAMGFVVSRALQVAAELGIADALADGAKDAEALAAQTGSHPATLHRILRLLASHGVFEQRPDGRYVNTALSEALRDGVPGSLRGLARMYGDAPMWRAWEALLHSARTGDPGFLQMHGVPVFDYLGTHPDSARRFDEAMVSSSELMNAGLVESFAWGRFGTLVDVGGGSGSTLAAILEANPGARGVLFDRAHVIERSRAYLAQRGVLDRCSTQTGSFFDAVPAGADGYFMKHIIHDWNDEDCLRILRACHTAMPDHATLLICEKVILPGNLPSYGKLTDLVMLAMTDGGRERTEQEFRALLAVGDFRLVRVIPTRSDNCLLEAVRV